MKKLILIIVFAVGLIFSFSILVLADKSKSKQDGKESASRPPQPKKQTPEAEVTESSIPITKTISTTNPVSLEVKPVDAFPLQNYELPWSSVNGSGDINMSSTNYRMESSSGQSVIGQAGSDNYKMGMGFWYGTVPSASPCVSVVVGDLALPLNGLRTPADVVTLINTVFKSRPLPVGVNPCAADINQSGGVPSPADVVTLINNVFKSRPLPAGDRCGC